MKNDEYKEEKKLKAMNEIYDEPSVFAISSDKPFVVASDKVKEFINIKPNLEILEKRKEILKKINIRVDIEPIKIEGPILKKIK